MARRRHCENGDCADHYGDPAEWCNRCRPSADAGAPKRGEETECCCDCVNCVTGNCHQCYYGTHSDGDDATAVSPAEPVPPVSGRDTRLRCHISDGKVIVEIGIDTLAFATKENPTLYQQYGYDYEKGEERKDFVTVTDADVWAKEVERQIVAESEDGSSLMTKLFDDAILAAIGDGAEGIDIPEIGPVPAETAPPATADTEAPKREECPMCGSDVPEQRWAVLTGAVTSGVEPCRHGWHTSASVSPAEPVPPDLLTQVRASVEYWRDLLSRNGVQGFACDMLEDFDSLVNPARRGDR